MLSSRERETVIFTARVARTYCAEPQHTANLGERATTLLIPLAPAAATKPAMRSS
jgi:hypothetical protein